jgi:hypothetical protein
MKQRNSFIRHIVPPVTGKHASRYQDRSLPCAHDSDSLISGNEANLFDREHASQEFTVMSSTFVPRLLRPTARCEKKNSSDADLEWPTGLDCYPGRLLHRRHQIITATIYYLRQMTSYIR